MAIVYDLYSVVKDVKTIYNESDADPNKTELVNSLICSLYVFFFLVVVVVE